MKLLASELAQMFLQVGAAVGSQESVPPQTSPVVSLILNHWRE